MKKRLSTIVILLALLCLSLFVVGCQSSSNEASKEQEENKNNISTEEVKNELIFANFRDIRDLNPHLYGGELYAQNMLYESLVKVTENGIEPWLAERWKISEDGKEYTFFLRKDVTFHDGEKFNADAAKANIDAILDNIERHGWLELVRLMEKVEIVDEYTLQIVMSEPYYPMLTELAVTRPFRFISPNAMIDGTTKDGVSEYFGTGPYVLTENKQDEYAVFSVNEDYWGEKPTIEKITVKVIPDNQTRVMALQNGEIDMIYGKNMIDAESFTMLEGNSNFETIMSEPISSRIILLNTTNSILNDVNVRKALQHAVSKEAISEGIFNGSEAPADTLLAKTVPYANIDLKPYAFDKEIAEQLLEEAGWEKVEGQSLRQKDGEVLQLQLHYNNDAVAEKSIGEFMQSELASIGIGLEIIGEEEQSYRDRQKAGNFDIIFDISWGTPYDPQSFLAGMKLPVYGDYYAQQGLEQKPQIDESITNALIATDEEERQELYTYILTTLHEEAVYIPLTYERNRAVFRQDLKNVTFNPSQFEIPFEKMYFGE
ncbi:nickel ABC transporter, nickel/metallophore periplasmic binding protein [Anaerobacillus alkalidiazotrophicus]|uniref:Nickel ABC transporter, nickel/metallophore periplasmic binding protein n=1 Tax=Anaerobacillus alkalidiazotrophicus TaxID=472963 RepID=A0A1S2M142_9BACI|nr:nickel ABC transporter substrate-binding protein [Anaerobacillus alkalidiazotrophicus]OIJ18183.1 nickel ABC transporter, nickel/metallophore periplasmic binding protein [Anaerobacillus alkalidiazotrophicus]OIJ19662.1 nickel ABC transporter, nickel/metallophore periplasmic binding protein [Anaerobacillus alkalidiazotrophicus]